MAKPPWSATWANEGTAGRAERRGGGAPTPREAPVANAFFMAGTRIALRRLHLTVLTDFDSISGRWPRVPPTS
jgi:hypothetical protein